MNRELTGALKRGTETVWPSYQKRAIWSDELPQMAGERTGDNRRE